MFSIFSNQKEILPLQLSASDNQITFGIHLDPRFSDQLWFCLHMSVTGGDDSRIRLDWAESAEAEPYLYMTHALIPNCTSVFSFPISK